MAFLLTARQFLLRNHPVLAVLSGATLSASTLSTSASKNPSALHKKEFRKVPLLSKQRVNHNTALLRFGLPEGHTTGMSVASCIMVRTPDRKGELAVRPYTPVTRPATTGHFDLLVKDYPEGNVSSFMHNMRVGDAVEVKGPFPKFPYKKNEFKRIGMVAGGTGITPMLQVIDEVLEDPSDTTKMTLVFANNTEDDILLRKELDERAKKNPDRFSVFHVLKDAPANWKGGKGFVGKAHIQEHLPAPDDASSMVFVCGPPPFYNAISGNKAPDYTQGELGGLLKELGYKKERVYKF